MDTPNDNGQNETTGDTLPNLKEDLKRPPKAKPKTKMITIDVHCKQYALIFANDPQQSNKISKAIRAKTPKSKPTTSEISAESTNNIIQNKTAAPTRPLTRSSTLTQATQSSSKGGIKLARFSRKKSTEVLGSLNVGSGGSPQKPSNHLSENNGTGTKRRTSIKRKRLVGDESEMAAENIPVEAVLPALRFGVNRDICPKKRRRLHSLISPDTPPSPPTPENPRRFRIARKY